MPPRKRVKETRVDASDECAGSAGSISEGKLSNAVSKRRPKNAGKPSLLLDMPTEVFTEIACYTSPEDLLNLARTSKGLRELLMSSSSKHIWESSRTVHNIPDRPSDLTEPQYADLLFGKGCSFCTDARTRKPLVVLRVRVCKMCAEDRLITIREVLSARRERKEDLPDGVDICAIIPSMDLRSVKFNGRTMRKVIASEVEQVLGKVDRLSSNAKALQKYVCERMRVTDTVYETKIRIDSWLRKTSQLKERSNEELMKDRRASITERLRELGYRDEDIDPRYDEKTWKWKQLLNQTRALSERVWQNIKPQLEETIQLRRIHVGHRFHYARRWKRQDEMTKRFLEFRPQLSHTPKAMLFTPFDLLELPIVKELIEEDDCRVPLTSDRWQLVATIVFDTVPVHAKMIERHCVEKMEAAIRETSQTTGHCLNFDNDGLDRKQEGDDDDHVPTCLLPATSLFGRDSSTSGSLDSYAEILRWRSYTPRIRNLDGRSAWGKENFVSSGTIIDTAFLLLERLQLPPETTMAYMLACGRIFKCSRCSYGTGSLAMAWPELVRHFIQQVKMFEDLNRRNIEREADVPIRNDHDLTCESDDDIVSRRSIVTVDMAPTSENGDRYSVLSDSWGAKPEYCSNPLDYDDFVENKKWCKLCEKLDFKYEMLSPGRMVMHMRAKHGTDLEGNLLQENNELMN